MSFLYHGTVLMPDPRLTVLIGASQPTITWMEEYWRLEAGIGLQEPEIRSISASLTGGVHQEGEARSTDHNRWIFFMGRLCYPDVRHLLFSRKPTTLAPTSSIMRRTHACLLLTSFPPTGSGLITGNECLRSWI
ncbi:hypothetical protein NPIL_13401 [Nephila pilipes]|uniref:Uncharacterized protein n=1 Tax=Nephila pilipes TaxID=299642 RepID=A0A8X6N1J8_NEPPI|nr:hypothetical protein NPIL_13401 [Nephila pilipes]